MAPMHVHSDSVVAHALDRGGPIVARYGGTAVYAEYLVHSRKVHTNTNKRTETRVPELAVTDCSTLPH